MFLAAFNSHFSGWVPVASLAAGTSFIDIFLNEAKRRMTTVPAIEPAMQVSHFADAQRGANFEFINHSDMFTMLPGEDCKLYIENAPYKGLSVYGKATDENIQLLAYMQMDITGGPYEGWPKFFHRTLPLNEVAGWDNPPGENFEGWTPLTIPDGVSVMAFFYSEVEASMMHGAPPADVVVINPIGDKVGEGDGDNKTKPVILKTWGNMLHSRLNPGQESKPTTKVQEASTPAELVDHLKQAAKPSESLFFKSPVTEVKEAIRDVLGELQETRNDSLKNIAEISKIGGIDQIALDFIPDALLRTELEELLRVIPAVVSHFPLIPVEGDRKWSKYVDVKAKSLKVFVTIDGVQFVLMYQAGDVGIHMKSARTEAGFEPKDPLTPVLLVKVFVAAMGSSFVCSRVESVLPTILAHLMDLLEQQK